MAKFVEDFGKDLDQNLTDGRLDAPAVHRNSEAILKVLNELLSGRSGHLIEIGCGTGQHAINFAGSFPDLNWWPTDPNPGHIESANAWRTHAGHSNIQPASILDASENWKTGKGNILPATDITAVFSANVVHIAPWSVAEGIISGAAASLDADGILIFYGPFSKNGDMLSEGNISFDRSLRNRNSEWGVRDITQIEEEASRHNMHLSRIFDMPSNNSMLVLSAL